MEWMADGRRGPSWMVRAQLEGAHPLPLPPGVVDARSIGRHAKCLPVVGQPQPAHPPVLCSHIIRLVAVPFFKRSGTQR